MKTIAVTGATGFVGGHLVRHLVSRGDRVIAFGRRDAIFAEPVTYRRWTLPNELAHPPVVDAVVHCAGSVSDWGPDATFQLVNVEGTRRVLATFAQARFVHLSTASVYDPWHPKDHVAEDAPFPRSYLNAYGRTKMLAEDAVRAARPDAVILRPHAVYGSGETKLIPRFLEARILGAQLAIGNGRNHVSITHIANLIQAVERAVDGTVSGVFNVADEVEPTVDELIRHVLECAGLSPRILYLPTSLMWPLAVLLETLRSGSTRPPRLTRYVIAQLAREYTLDIGAARDRLGYRPTATYVEGIRETLGSATITGMTRPRGVATGS